MYVHRSNRTETLVDVLADVVSRPLANPLAAECIVVQGRGMERWISMQLAQRLGVWANPDFPFPRHLILRTVGDLLRLGDLRTSPFEPEVLMWSVADLLDRFLDRPEFAAIAGYLAGDDRGVHRIQLAERIARTFDQYVVYRPEMVLSWERGDETHWQAVLWRALVERHGPTHMARHAQTFLENVRRPAPQFRDTPKRISVFGISTLAPLYLQMLAALAPHVELHLFLLSPSAEYWADIRSHREVLRTLARQGAGPEDIDQTLRRDDGNPLLASFGRVGRDFQLVLEANVDYQETDHNLYADPGTGTMLTAVQSDILALRHRRPGNPEAPPLPLDPGDDSITIHACHAPMREIEVLHDQLLALFDQDPTLEPRDVVVMSPDIDAYAPFIDAVFGGAAEQQPRIPYRIADRAVRATDDAVAAFLLLLDTVRGRLPASAVLDVLGCAPVRERFGFVADDLDLLRHWIKESGIRWGIDAAHREQAEQPPLPQNTWRFGLDRLLLGYSMPGKGRRVFAGVLPYDDVEGTTTDVLGRFVEFCEVLFGFQRSLRTPRSVDAWRDDLGRLLETIVASPNETAYQHRRIRAALDELAEHARTGGFCAPIDLDIVRMLLAVTLERGAPGRGFLTGGVTFCSLVPMRSIPFRVVCLLGMNDTDFPRVRRPPAFDRIAQRPQPGDRSTRDDDRYLFLEALLSARQRVLITYVGQSVRDNGEIPPSVVVSELLDVIEESFVLPPSDVPGQAPDTVRARVVVRHPLQPFSPRYFGSDRDPRLFSYARNYCEGARALRGHRQHLPPFVSAPLALDPAAPREVSIDALARFFENPTRAFLHSRLSLYLGRDLETVDDREPLVLTALERWKVGDGLLERALDDEPIAHALPSVRASGVLPPGALGTCVFDALTPEVLPIASLTRRLRDGERLQALVIDEQLDSTRVTGAISELWPEGHVRYRFSKLGGRHELGLWIRHLVLNWLQRTGYPRVSYLVGRPLKDGGATAIRFRPVDDAAGILRELLDLYWVGQTVPLPLFEKASRAYAEHLHRQPGKVTAALQKACGAFDGHQWGDRSDDYVRQVYAASDPLGAGGATDLPGFASLALTVFQPMLEHREEVR